MDLVVWNKRGLDWIGHLKKAVCVILYFYLFAII